METVIVILLVIMGVVLLLIELFLIPGISVAGIAGVLFFGGAIYYAYDVLGTTAGHLTLFASIVVLALAIWIFLRSRALEKMALNTEIDSKNDPLKDVKVHSGDTGVTVSRLAPMGKVKVNGFIVEAKTNSDFIDDGAEIVVLEVLSTNLLVEKKA